jgi:mono/diheme cytochrome c family protein
MKVTLVINLFKISLAFLLYGNVVQAFAQTDSIKNFKSGKNIFQTYCSPCHGVHKEIIGPMLASVTKKLPEEWLFAFIRNSQQVIASGDEYANFLFKQYNQAVMPAFRKLSGKDISDILFYIEKESINATEEAGAIPAGNQHYSHPDIQRGKELFTYQCASCHYVTIEEFGPALGSVSKRRPQQWLIDFIKNSQQVIQSGDPYAVHLFNQYDQRIMVSMEFLTREDILSILNYIEFASASPPAVAGVNGRKVSHFQVHEVDSVGFAEYNKESTSSVKITFILLSLIGATIHGYLIIRLFLYLYRKP